MSGAKPSAVDVAVMCSFIADRGMPFEATMWRCFGVPASIRSPGRQPLVADFFAALDESSDAFVPPTQRGPSAVPPLVLAASVFPYIPPSDIRAAVPHWALHMNLNPRDTPSQVQRALDPDQARKPTALLAHISWAAMPETVSAALDRFAPSDDTITSAVMDLTSVNQRDDTFPAVSTFLQSGRLRGLTTLALRVSKSPGCAELLLEAATGNQLPVLKDFAVSGDFCPQAARKVVDHFVTNGLKALSVEFSVHCHDVVGFCIGAEANAPVTEKLYKILMNGNETGMSLYEETRLLGISPAVNVDLSALESLTLKEVNIRPYGTMAATTVTATALRHFLFECGFGKRAPVTSISLSAMSTPSLPRSRTNALFRAIGGTATTLSLNGLTLDYETYGALHTMLPRLEELTLIGGPLVASLQPRHFVRFADLKSFPALRSLVSDYHEPDLTFLEALGTRFAEWSAQHPDSGTYPLQTVDVKSRGIPSGTHLAPYRIGPVSLKS